MEKIMIYFLTFLSAQTRYNLKMLMALIMTGVSKVQLDEVISIHI